MRLFTLFAVALLCSCAATAQPDNHLKGNPQEQNQRSDHRNGRVKPAPFPLQLEMRVPFEPTAFPSGPHLYIFYELHLTNWGAGSTFPEPY